MPQWVTSLDLDHKNTISIGNKLYCKPSMMVLLGYCTIRDRPDAASTDTHATSKNASSRNSSAYDKIESNIKDSSMASSRDTALVNAGRLVNKSTTAHSVRTKTDYAVIRIYDLVAAIVPWIRTWVYSPKVFGMIASNKFELTKSHIRLRKKANYAYSRGDCCG
ncbi:hypothetical protein DYB32_006959 [Aphanomyces invadans]|uniref:Uncharacterized protein n=1 Tax=Aphanomyces invadans TaxID=157072 RepID=A0A3R6YVU4_9STRA|nr:hypothetical protein DYB32_006959 [Aphanomyces invadans]